MKTAVYMLLIAGVAANPASFDERKARVRALLDSQDFAAALTEAKSINHEWADDVPSYGLMAEAYLGLGDYNEAESSLQWMLNLRIGKTDARGWLLVARFREVTGDLDGAIEAVNNAAVRFPAPEDRERRSALAYLARLYCVSGKLDLAERVLQSAGPAVSEPTVLDALARLRLAQGKRSESAAVLRDLFNSTKHPAYAWRLAEVTRSPSDYAAFDRSARERTGLADNANRELVLYLLRPGGRPAEALEIARSESRRRHDVYTLDALSLALFANGAKSEAELTMRRVLDVGTRDPGILEHAARIGVKGD